MATKAREARSRLGVARAAAVLAIVCATALLAGAERASSSAIGPCGSNPVVCENQLPGTPQSEWDIQGSGDPTIQGYATPFSVADGQTGSVQGRHRCIELPPRYLPARLVRRARRSARDDGAAVGAASPESTGLHLPGARPPGRLRELGGIGFVGRPAGRRFRGLHRAARAHRHRRGQPRRLRRSRRPVARRPALPDLRHDLAGIQPLRRLQPLCRPDRACVQGQLQPSLRDANT